jgi:hypothetical protein
MKHGFWRCCPPPTEEQWRLRCWAILNALRSVGAMATCLAHVHLTHARLPELQDAKAAARRLFMADAVMKAGGRPRTIFEALGLDASYVDAVEKLYNPDEPRVPAGGGRQSGQWTRLLSWIGELDAAELAELGAYASRVVGPAGAAAVFGLLFIPSSNNVRVEGEVPELTGPQYSWKSRRGPASSHVRRSRGSTAHLLGVPGRRCVS